MIKNFVINTSLSLINNMHIYGDEKLEEIKYGLEGLYLTLSKIIVILIISAILGLLKEDILFLLFFNFLRFTAFGIHATKSLYCWISSGITFILIPYLCKNLVYSNWFYIIISIITLIIFILYAPADTINRPLINTKKRQIYKFISIVLSAIYITLIFVINNLLIKNILTFSLILESILILPITYKIFNLPYNNYKNYKE